jgi:hypothetical protein
MSEKYKAVVKYSAFEYKGDFEQPVFDNNLFSIACKAAYAALKPWNIAPQDVRFPNASTAADPLAFFEVSNKKYVFGLNRAALTLRVEWVAWDQSELILTMMESFAKAVCSALGVSFLQHTLSILMQVVPDGTTIANITKPLVNALTQTPSPSDFCGFSLHTKSATFLVDKSIVNLNGLFIRIDSTFDGGTPLAQMAEGMRLNEYWIAETLGLEIE